MPVVIREATGDDVPLVARLIRDSFRDVAERFGLTRESCPTHPSHCTDEWITSAMAKGVRYALLEAGKDPCGCVAMEQARPGLWYLESLSVLPEYRRKGFGTALVRHALDEARKAGAQRVEIGIIAEHTELRDWYAKLGFLEKETVRFDHLPFAVTFMFTEV